MAARVKPRISVNKLGEYLKASASRRRTIVREQKRPRDVVVARYVRAYPIMATYAAAGRPSGYLRDEIEAIATAPAKTPWQEQDNELSAEALEHFAKVADRLDLNGCSIEVCAADQPKLEIAGVAVSVRPELVLRDGRGRTGAVKLVVTKGNPISDYASYIGTAVHQYLAANDATADVDHRLCHVVDVFAEEVYTAPRNFKRLRADITAACEEIARAWPAA